MIKSLFSFVLLGLFVVACAKDSGTSAPETLESLTVKMATDSKSSMSIQDITAGDHLLAQLDQVMVVTNSRGNKASVEFTQEVTPPGTLDTKQKAFIKKEEVPVGMDYEIKVPLALPTKLSKNAQQLNLFTLFYQATLTRWATDNKGNVKWEVGADATQGHNLGSLFKKELEKRQGDTVYYYGNLKDIGEYAGYVDKTVLAGNKSATGLNVVFRFTHKDNNPAIAYMKFSYTK